MMLKHSLVIALSVFMALFIAACGSYTTTGGGAYGGGSSNPAAITTPTTHELRNELLKAPDVRPFLP